jgi:repressor LexA
VNLQEFGEYLKNLRKSKDISLRQVDYSSEVTFSNLSMIESGKRRPTPFVLKELSKVYHVDYIDLLEKAGYLDLAEAEKINGKNVYPTTDIPLKLPVLGKISAGLPILAQENIEGYEFAPSSFIKEGFDYFYLKVTGDSMNLKFPEGNLVLVQKQPTLENGEIGVILVGDTEATVKKYRCENDLVILEPMSTNPEHTVQIYNPKNVSVKIIGKVILHLGKV